MTDFQFSFPLIALDETHSTSNYLLELCQQSVQPLEEFTTVTASFQTAGKGQRGNSWESEAGKNLLFSFVLYPKFLEVRQQFLLSQFVSLAIKEKLESIAEEISIKWPNDIYWREKKLCGMLIEHQLCGSHIERTICGIGVNINQALFRSNAPNPVSLKQICGRELDINQVLAGIMQRVQHYYHRLIQEEFDTVANEIAQRYSNSLFRREGFHRYKDVTGEFRARLLQVESDGRFRLEDETGRERSYLFKEVQYIL